MANRNDSIQVIDNLDRKEFISTYFSTNTPVLVRNAMVGVPSKDLWNFQYFRNHCGETQVTVFHEENNTNIETEMKLSEYFELFEYDHLGKTNFCTFSYVTLHFVVFNVT